MGKFSRIKKYSKPSLEVNEKIEKLNKELEKTGVLFEAPTNSTSGLYSGQDQEDTTQNTNTRIKDPDGGSNTSGVPYEGTYGNYDPSGTVSYFSFSGNGNYNIGATIRGFDEVTDGDGNGLGYYKIRITPSYGVSYLHLDSIWTERTGVLNAYWKVVGRRVGGQEIDLLLGTQFWDRRPTSISFWSNNVAQPIPGEVRQKPSWYHFMRRDGRSGDGGYGTQDPWEKVQGMLDAGKEWMDRVIGDVNPIDAVFRVFENTARLSGLYGAANTLREYGNFTAGRVSYTSEKPKMTVSSSEERREILKQAEGTLFAAHPLLTPTYEGVKNKHYKRPVTEKEKQRARKIIGESLAKAINNKQGNLYYQHGAVSSTFHKSPSNKEGISPDGKGGLNVNDGYDFVPKEGQTGTENARVPGLQGYALEALAMAVTYDARNKEYEKKGKGYGSITELPRMPIRTTFTKEDLKGTSLGQLLDDIGFNNSLKEDRTIKRVSSATKDPSPILETKTIQTEQKSPARFLVKEKKEDTSRARWLKRA